MRPGPREAGGGDDDGCALPVEHGELTTLRHASLVDVAGQDELGAGCGKLFQYAASSRERPLARPPGRVRELVVETHDAQCPWGRGGELFGGTLHRSRPQTARLVPPGPDGVDPHDVQPVRRVHRLRRRPLALELPPRMREATRRQQRDVVIAGDCEHGRGESSQECRNPLVLIAPSAVRQVARRDDEVGLRALDEGSQRALQDGLLACPDVDVGDVDQASGHSRGRLYTGHVPDESTESTELFDDLYLGLRAGGAIRKQRRGEPLTMEEEAAIGHWQRLSSWRKVIAVGAFALGTFGLGFTLGGLIFRRRRNA